MYSIRLVKKEGLCYHPYYYQLDGNITSDYDKSGDIETSEEAVRIGVDLLERGETTAITIAKKEI